MQTRGVRRTRRVAAFTDEMIRAAVHVGQFSDPAAEKHLADVLIQRRDKITSTYLPAVNPIVSPGLDGAGRLSFENAAVSEGVVQAPASYRASWLTFDNATGDTKPLGDSQGTTTSLEAPRGLPTAAGSMIAVDIAAESAAQPAWKQPIRTHFRREGDGWKLVGLERLPDAPAATAAPAKPAR